MTRLRCPHIALLASLLFGAAPSAAQTIYKCAGPSGTVYSEKPCGPSAEVKTVTPGTSWTVEPAHTIPQAAGKVASIRNASGHLLQVYRIHTNAVWMRFALNPDRQLALDHRFPPAIQLDDAPEDDLRSTRNLVRTTGINGYVEEAQAIQFLIWHGNEAEGLSTRLKQLMSGRSVRIRYRTDGATEPGSTSFSLAGARVAIAGAIGVSDTIDPAKEARLQAYRAAVIDASRQCTQDADPLRCIQRGERCGDQHRGDADAFTACFAGQR